ncbi:hypothetical protein V8F20_006846 [Naviculisporaceae sp. PSN 640]
MSDASEESDHFDGLVQEHDDSDNRSDASGRSGRHSENDDDSDSDRGQHFISRDLLDMSAEEDDEGDESDGGSESSDSEDSMDGYLNRMERSESPELHFFPQFKRLPIELRYRIWELFCPEILADRRVYPFCVRVVQHRISGERSTHISPDIHLDLMTESSRTVLAVHRESRELARRVFPDTLPFPGGTLRFNKAKDVILMNEPDYRSIRRELTPLEPSTMNQIRNIAFTSLSMTDYDFPLQLWNKTPLLKFWEDPGMIYFRQLADDERRHRLYWCGDKDQHHYRVEVCELGEHGLRERVEYHYVWPNVDKHPRVLENYIDSEDLPDDLTYDKWVESLVDEEQFYRTSIFPNRRDVDVFDQIRDRFLPILQPMVEFMTPYSNRLFEKLAQVADGDAPSDIFSSDFDEYESEEPDEYESSGIDDSDVEEDSENSADEEDDLVVVDDDSGDESTDGGASTFAGFSPPHDRDSSPVEARELPRMIDLTEDDDGAKFSSPEPEPEDDESHTIKGSDSDEEEKDEEDVRGRRPRTRRRGVIDESDEGEETGVVEQEASSKARKRKRVLDSDDEEEVIEDDEEEEAPRKRSRTSRSRRDSGLIVLPSDDSEEEIIKMREHARRARAIIIDDEDEDEDEEAGGSHRSSSDGDSESEEEEETKKPMSLMERLALHRRDNPIPGDSNDEEDEDEDPDIEEMGEDDYDARNYADFEDDDERMDPDTDGGMDDEEAVDYDEGYDEEEEEYY